MRSALVFFFCVWIGSPALSTPSPSRRVSKSRVSDESATTGPEQTRQKLVRIAVLEDQGWLGYGQLLRYLKDAEPVVRQRAARSCGIIQDSLACPVLIQALKDRDSTVRQEAAFALGQIQCREAKGALLKATRDRSPTVRQLALEALGKLGDTTVVDRIAKFLSDPSSALRGEAALALARLKSHQAIAPLARAARDWDPAVRWKAVYALFRQNDSVTIPILEAKFTDNDPYVRAFAARGLGQLHASAPAMVPLLSDPDWRVQVQAVRALGQSKASESLLFFLEYDRREGTGPLSNPYLVGEELTALGSVHSDSAYQVVRAFLASPIPDLRARATAALAQIDSARALEDLKPLRSDTNWHIRAQAAEAFGAIRTPEAFALLESLFVDPDYRVRYPALEAMGKFPTERWEPFVKRALGEDEQALIATASEIAGKAHDSTLLNDLVVGFWKHRMDRETDAKIAILEALERFVDAGRLSGTIAQALDFGLQDTNRLVRQLAVKIFRKAGLERGGFTGTFVSDMDAEKYRAVYEQYTTNPKAAITTGKGIIVLELLPREAPRTVANFIKLAQTGFYDNRVWHRVVPNFVIQDGCPRGDGWGGPGYTIRCEYNKLHYERGTVGMALSGKDTGGSQYFITQSPQPHLDGRYTIFARVVEGMEVVDKIMVGDKIEKVTIIE